jgi:uncharacterized protein
MARQFAIVTGASSGIGLSLAKELAARGYDLAILLIWRAAAGSRRRTAFQGAQVTEILADLATRNGVKQFWDQVLSLGQNIDVACINAGDGPADQVLVVRKAEIIDNVD